MHGSFRPQTWRAIMGSSILAGHALLLVVAWQAGQAPWVLRSEPVHTHAITHTNTHPNAATVARANVVQLKLLPASQTAQTVEQKLFDRLMQGWPAPAAAPPKSLPLLAVPAIDLAPRVQLASGAATNAVPDAAPNAEINEVTKLDTVATPLASSALLTTVIAQPASAQNAVRAAQADHRHCPAAPYPPALRERGIEGAVTLRVRVDAQGLAADVQLLAGSGYRLFDEAALWQAQRCRFQPAMRGETALESWVEFPVRFAIHLS